MAKRTRQRRINPVATAPILRKGGVHTVSRSGERQREKQKVKQMVQNIKAGFSGLDAVWGSKNSLAIGAL
ncbi:MAG: hypothetical protein R3E95_24320 [Thiolinea sp.]